MARLSETGTVPILNPLTPTSGRRREEPRGEMPARRTPKPEDDREGDGAGSAESPSPDDPSPERGLLVDEYA